MQLRRQVPVPSLAGRLCVVTGAASGIGRATAVAAARAGGRLVITDPDAVRRLAADTHDTHGSADVVMNVAGIATWGAVERLTHEQWRRTVDVDLMGPIHVIESFVPEMVRAGRGGQLVNVASAAALVGLPWHAPYSAAKFGLRGVSEVLRFDLRRLASGITQRFLRHAAKPDEVAERIIDGITRNRYLVHTATDVRLMHAAQKFTPHVRSAATAGTGAGNGPAS
jgi:NAD(P)-dependent dehydrogenase (short-subunit alcohol dehydrogenase family)